MSPQWLIARSKPLTMASLAKCASTSLRAYEGFYDFRAYTDVNNIPTRVAWIRHPIERMHSAWRGFYIRSPIENWRWGLAEPELAEWEAFVDHTFEHHNQHWSPQIPQLTYDGEYFPTISERYENLHDRFNQYLPGTLPHHNRGMDRPVNLKYRRRELEEKYRADLDLWESI